MTNRAAIIRFTAAAAGCLAALTIFTHVTGAFIYLCLAAALAAAVMALAELATMLGLVGPRLTRKKFHRAALAAAAAFAALAAAEAGLHGLRDLAARSDPGRAGLTIPPEWQRRETAVPGAKTAFYWHGKLHVFDAIGMRRTAPFPERRPGVCRVMVVGDSETYGYGVAAEEAYPQVLEQLLAPDYRIEVLNLGICGYQSENIRWVLTKFAPALKPDLVVYGVCLNDFLPSQVGSYKSDLAYPFPLPRAVKLHLSKNTLAGELIAAAYDHLLFKLGLRHDFYGDVLRDRSGYQQKFRRDAAAMNRFNRQLGLPPITAMVVNQTPKLDSRALELIHVAEKILTEAGFNVAPATPYFEQYSGADWAVSKWEKHPKPEAHRVFAERFAAALRELPQLQPCRRTPSENQ